MDDKIQEKESEELESSVKRVKAEKTDGIGSFFTTALERSIKFDVVLRDLFLELSQDSEEYILSDLAFDQEQI